MNRLRRMGRNSSQQADQTEVSDGDESGAMDPGPGIDGDEENTSEDANLYANTEGSVMISANGEEPGGDSSTLFTDQEELPSLQGGEEAVLGSDEPGDEPGVEDQGSGTVEGELLSSATDIEDVVSEGPTLEASGGEDASNRPDMLQEGQTPDVGAANVAERTDSPGKPVRRRSARTAQNQNQRASQTAPLPPVLETEALTPLPVGAVVDSRYIVQSQLHHSLDRNLYRVTARQQQWCGNCGRLSSSSAETCAHCGSLLEGQVPAEFYLMAESYRSESLIRDPSLMSLNLYHPNLVPVIDFFSYKPFGTMRYFAVAEPRQGVRLSQLSMPRAGGQVLSWAMQLADALSYLHDRGVVGAGAEADDILVQGDRASLASLQNAHATTADDPELAQHQSVDLARLASTMYEAFTGQQSSLTPEGSLTIPPGAPEQVGTAFRAAIEPMQGTSPVISVAVWRDLLARALDAVDELERPGRPIEFTAFSMTNVGRVREQNQDSFATAEWVQASVEGPMRVGLYIVADGMGGHKGGEIASALAAQSVSGELAARVVAPLIVGSGDRSVPSNEAILQGMTRAVQSANERIYKARDNRQNDMGTTLVAALVAGGKAYIANVGDSRLYIYSAPHQPVERSPLDATRPLVKGADAPLQGTTPFEGENDLDVAPNSTTEPAPDGSGYTLSQVSIDHSLVHRLVELGQLDAEEAKVHPHRNFIYRSLGGPPPVEVDTFVRALYPGDRLLLCSDGLNSMIEDEDIERVLATEKDAHVACQRLIDLANEAGGHDNITVLLIDVLGYLPLPEHPFALNNA